MGWDRVPVGFVRCREWLPPAPGYTKTAISSARCVPGTGTECSYCPIPASYSWSISTRSIFEYE